MPVYSTLFASIVLSATGSGNLYVVPDGYTAVLRELTFYNGSGSSSAFLMFDPGSSVTYLNTTVGAGAVGEWQGRFVFDSETAIAYFITAEPWHVRASGYLLRA